MRIALSKLHFSLERVMDKKQTDFAGLAAERLKALASYREALAPFGFDEYFAASFLEAAEAGEVPARVVEVQRGRYGLILPGPEARAESADATLRGRLSYEARLIDETGGSSLLPAVGDWVVARSVARSAALHAASSFVIASILPRRSAFARRESGGSSERLAAQVLAANVDTAFIVAAADQRWSPRRIERYVTLAYEAGVAPVVVVTKADMAEDGAALVDEARGLSPGIEAVLVCAPEGRGLESLSPWLKSGKTVVLLGSSGAGKSTLLNALAGREVAATSAVRADDDRGRHTTTHRELYRLPSGALVIDSPGLREIQILAGEDALAEAFADVEALAARCRFRDCSHEAEPGCAVRAALESGELERGRFEGWRKISREVAFLAAREDPRAAAERAQRWKIINKSMRGYTKERRSIQGKAR
jgi:ribosome biogenesis GTPase / thiamine phosphate phosphatase